MLGRFHISTLWLAFLCASILFVGCTKNASNSFSGTPAYSPAYASGFDLLTDDAGRTLLVTKTPFQGADSAAATSLMLLPQGVEAPQGFSGQLLAEAPRRIVCLSSTHVAMLEKLGLADRVVGVSGFDYITSPAVRGRAAEVVDIGYDGNFDYEKLISVKPDLVMLYGVNAPNEMEPRLRRLGIPFVYIGDYLEPSPLGKAEWLVAVGAITGTLDKARELYADIPRRYMAIKQMADSAASRPKVMLNTPYGDQWVMASTDSYLAALIRDAGGDYLWHQGGNASRPIDLEQAYSLVNQCDLWLNPGAFRTLAELKHALPKFADTPVMRDGKVFNNTARMSPSGANDYWESGLVNPDVVLRDLYSIFHGGDDANLIYYEHLK